MYSLYLNYAYIVPDSPSDYLLSPILVAWRHQSNKNTFCSFAAYSHFTCYFVSWSCYKDLACKWLWHVDPLCQFFEFQVKFDRLLDPNNHIQFSFVDDQLLNYSALQRNSTFWHFSLWIGNFQTLQNNLKWVWNTTIFTRLF